VGRDLAVFRNNEKTGRRFCCCRGELNGTGDDGGLDRGASSDHIAGEFLGLDVGGSDDSRGAVEISGSDSTRKDAVTVVWTVWCVDSTRLRLVGGPSSYSERFCRE